MPFCRLSAVWTSWRHKGQRISNFDFLDARRRCSCQRWETSILAETTASLALKIAAVWRTTTILHYSRVADSAMLVCGVSGSVCDGLRSSRFWWRQRLMGATANAFGRVQGQRLQSIRNLEHFPMDLRATELHLYVFSSQRRGMARARRPTRLPLPFGTYLCVIVKSGKGAGLMTHFAQLACWLPCRFAGCSRAAGERPGTEASWITMRHRSPAAQRRASRSANHRLCGNSTTGVSSITGRLLVGRLRKLSSS